MEYNPPLNGDLTDPDRQYIDGDKANSITGSVPSAVGIGHAQREIVNAIIALGLEPTGEQTDQLATGLTALINSIPDIPETDAVPVGTTIEYSGTTAPDGYLEENGAAISRTTYADLYAVIGTTYGSGDGSTTFNLPNSERRVAVGAGGTGTSTLGNAVGDTGGEETHTLSTSEMPSHSHTIGGTYSSYRSESTSNNPSSTYGCVNNTSTTSGSAGSGSAHNNMQPSIVKMKCIKY